MVFRIIADVVAVLHGAFLLYVALGGFVAWRWPRTMWLHVVAVAWGFGIVVVGWECPLTDLEDWCGKRGGEEPRDDGFVDRYVEDVIYPERFTPWVRTVAVCTILISWSGVVVRRRQLSTALSSGVDRARGSRRAAPPSRHG